MQAVHEILQAVDHLCRGSINLVELVDRSRQMMHALQEGTDE